MKRFYFTDENGDNIMNDHIGNIRGARRKAENYIVNNDCEVIYINDCETEDIVDCIFK